MRENKADGGLGGQSQFRDDGFEIMAIGTQAVQPDNRCIGGI
jgi:hypothetical protein